MWWTSVPFCSANKLGLFVFHLILRQWMNRLTQMTLRIQTFLAYLRLWSLEAILAELLDGARKDILVNVHVQCRVWDWGCTSSSKPNGHQIKLAKVQSKYLRPENCTNLVAPTINKQIWQQLCQETKNDSVFQKAQSLLLSGLYAVLQTYNSSSGEQNVLTHGAVLLLLSNREVVIKQRDFIHPDLNKQYASLCNRVIFLIWGWA